MPRTTGTRQPRGQVSSVVSSVTESPAELPPSLDPCSEQQSSGGIRMIPRISVPVQKNPSMLLGPGNAGGRGDHSFEPEEIEIDSFLLEEARRPPEVFDRYAGMGAPEQPQVLGVYIAIEVHGP